MGGLQLVNVQSNLNSKEVDSCCGSADVEASAEDKFIWTEAHKRAAGQLEFAVNSPTNITLMLGKSGVGKSRLVEEVVEYVMLDQAVAFFTNPRLLDEDLIGTVRTAVMGLADTYRQNATPIFVVDDAHLLHHDTLNKLLYMSHPPDGGKVVFKLVLVAQPGFDEDLKSIAPGNSGPAFELWPLDENDANIFVDAWLTRKNISDIFEDQQQRSRMLERAKGVPGALVGALEWHMRKSNTAAPVKEKPELGDKISDAKKARPNRNGKTIDVTEVVEPTIKEATFETPSKERHAIGDANSIATNGVRRDPKPCESVSKHDEAPCADTAFQSTRSSTLSKAPEPATESHSDGAAKERHPVASLAGLEPAANFRLEVAVKQQKEFKQELRSLEYREERAHGMQEIASELELRSKKVRQDTFAPTPKAFRPSKAQRNFPGGASLAGLAAMLLVGAFLGQWLSNASTAPRSFAAAPQLTDVVSIAPVMESVLALPGDASSILRTAVGLGRTDGASAAAAYAVAAAMQEPRAAYYLGQVYESGEGVTRNESMAYLGYQAAATEIPAANTRAEALRSGFSSLETRAPKIEVIHAHQEASRKGVFLWHTRNAGPDVSFEIQFADQNGEILKKLETRLPAILAEIPVTTERFKVTSKNESETVSTDWMRIEESTR